MSPQKILYIVSEIEPFLSLCPSAEWVNKLAVDLTQKKNEVRVIMPRFHTISERTNSIHSVQRLSGINVSIGHTSVSLIVKVATIKQARLKVQVYFIEHEELFAQKDLYEEKKGAIYPDRDERFIFMNKSALAIVKHLIWAPDIVHTIGWQWSLVPLYGKLSYGQDPLFEHAHFVHTSDEPFFEKPFGKTLLEQATTYQVTPEQLAPLPSQGDSAGLQQLVHRYADKLTHSFDPTGHPTEEALQKTDSLYIPNDDNLVSKYEDLYNSLV